MHHNFYIHANNIDGVVRKNNREKCACIIMRAEEGGGFFMIKKYVYSEQYQMNTNVNTIFSICIAVKKTKESYALP